MKQLITQIASLFIGLNCIGRSSLLFVLFTLSGISLSLAQTAANISVSGATGNGGVYIIGDLVTASWNNSATGDNVAGVTSVDFDFTQFGGGVEAASETMGGNQIWEATFTIVQGAIDNESNKNVEVQPTGGGVDVFGNDNVTVDNTPSSNPTTLTFVADNGVALNNTNDDYDLQFTGPADAFSYSYIISTTGDGSTIVVTDVAHDFTVAAGVVTIDAADGAGITDGTLSVSITVKDEAGNESGALVGGSVTKDVIVPTVLSINRESGQANPTNGGSALFTVTFSESVSGIDVDDFTLVDVSGTITGESITSVSSTSGTSIDVTVNTGSSGNGDLRLDFEGADATGLGVSDAAGNITTGTEDATGNETITVDKTIPTVVSINRESGQANPTNGGSALFTVTFSESVSGIDVDDFTLVDVSGTITGESITSVSSTSGTSIDVTVNTGSSGNGDLRLDFEGADATGLGVSDAAGNITTGTQDATGNETITVDKTIPTVVSINRESGQANPTNGGSALYTVTFSESVSGIDVDDFTLVDVSGTITGESITSVSSASGTSIDVTVNTGSSGSGDLRLDFEGADATGLGVIDAAGNITTGTQDATGNETITVDKTTPTVLSINRESGQSNPTNGGSALFTVTFSESVSGIDVNDFALVDVSGTITGESITSVSAASGTSVDVTVNTGSSGSGDLRLDFEGADATGLGVIDAAGNITTGTQDATGDETITVDKTTPTVLSINRESGQSNPTNGGSALFTVTFSKSVSGIDVNDFALVDVSGTITGESITSVSAASGTSVDVTVNTGSSGSGDLRLDFEGADATGLGVIDAAGNITTGTQDATGDETITVDKTTPTVLSINRESGQSNPTNGGSALFTVTFSESVSGIDVDDFTLVDVSGTITGESITSVSTASGTSVDVTVNTGSSGSGDLRLDFEGADATGLGVIDAAGNITTGTQDATGNETITVDKSLPTVTNLEILDTNGDGLIDQIDITFSENIDTDNGNAPVLADLGTLTLPDGEVVGTVSSPTISDPGGSASVVSVTVIVDQLIMNTGVDQTDFVLGSGLWVDNAGNALQAIASGATTIIDAASPIITDQLLFSDNSYIDITFSEGIYATGASALSNAISNEFAFSFNDNGSGATASVSSIEKTTGGNPTGGEETLRFNLSIGGSPTDGGETIEITPSNGSSVYDNATVENAMPGTETSGVVNLFNSGGYITNVGGFTSISSIRNTDPGTTATAIVFQFSITNPNSGSGDRSIKFTGMTFTQGTSNTVTDWTDVIEGARLEENGTPGDNSTSVTINPTSLVFTGINNANNAWGDINELATTTYNLKVWLKDPITNVQETIDNLVLQFRLVGTDINFTTNSSYDLTATSDDSSDQVDIDVIGTQLAIDSGDDPSNGTFEKQGVITATIVSTDANGNYDLGETVLVDVSQTAGSGTLTGDLQEAQTSGSVTFSDLNIDAVGSGNQLTFVDNAASLTSVVASSITIDDNLGPIIVSTSPVDGFGTVPLNSSFIATYDENIEKGTGSIFIVEDELPPVVTEYDVNDAEVSVSNNVLTINPTVNLKSVTDYYILIDAGAVVDEEVGANGTLGITNDTEWNFTTDAELIVNSFTVSSNTEIVITFNENVQISQNIATDFNVLDALANNIGVTSISDNTPADNQLELNFSDLSTAVGDITISYTSTGGNDDIQNIGATRSLADFGAVDIDLDQTSPAIASANQDNSTQITVTFDEPVQSNDTNPTDFTVVDGQGTGFTVSAQSDVGGGSTDIILTVANMSAAVGDLTVSYSDANQEINDFGGNAAASGSAVINIDTSDPELSSAATNGNTQIDVTFNEDVQINNASPSGDFVITDGAGNIYSVSAINDGTPSDTDIELTVQNFSSALGDLTVTYNRTGSDIQDFGGNSLATNAIGIDINRDNVAPTLTITRNAVSSGTLDATNDTQVSFNLAFSEEIDVSTFDATDDITISGPATFTAIVDGDLTNPSNDNQNFTLTVSGVGGTGSLGIAVAASSVTDFGSNNLGTITGTSPFTIDTSAPTVGTINIGTSNPTPYSGTGALVGDMVRISFTSNEALTANPTVQFFSGTSSNLGLTNGAVTITNPSANDYTATYTVSDLDNSGDVYFNLDMTDLAGNSSSFTSIPAANVTLVGSAQVDAEAPEVESITLSNLTSGSVSSTNQDNIEYTIVFSEGIRSSSFTYSDDITLNATGGVTVGGATLIPDVGNVIWTLTLTGIIGNGTLGFNIINNGTLSSIIDGVGNTIPGIGVVATSNETITFDNIFPGVTITALSPGSGVVANTNSNSLSFGIVFTEAIDAGSFSLNDITINAGGDLEINSVVPNGLLASNTLFELASTNVISLVNSGDNTNYTLTIGNASIGDGSGIITGNGDLGITLSGSGIQDAADNFLGGGVNQSNGVDFTVDNEVPTLDALSISSSNTTDSKHARATEVVTLTMDFDDDLVSSPIVSFRSGSVPVQDATITYTEVSDFVADGDEVWTAAYTVDAADFDGDVDFTLTFTDVAGNSGATSDNTDLDSGGATQTVEVDKAVPTLTSVTLATSNSTDNQHATTGETVTLSFTSSDDLSANPVVTMSVNDGTTTLAAVDGVTLTPGASNTYTATFVVDSETVIDAADNEGSVEFTIDFIDDAGNVGTQVSTTTNSSSVEVDYTVPTLDALSISSSNTTDSKHAKATEVVTLTMDFDDDLSSSPTVVFTSGSAAVADATITYTEVSDFTDDGNEVWTASYTVDASDTDGQVDFTLTYNDDAGNAGVALDNTSLDGGGASETIEIDKSAPTLDALSISSTNTTDSKHARATEVVTLTMDFDDDLATSPTVSFRSGSVPVQDATITYTEVSDFVADGDEVWTASYTVDAADFDGDVNFTLTYTDDVGNSGATSDNTDLDGGGATQTVEVDKAVPTLTSVTLATSNSTDNQHATTGETVTLSFTSSDDLSANPVVTMSVNDGTTTLAAVDGVTLTPGASNTYTATFVVDSETVIDAADNEGSVEFTIDFIDDAGNVGTQVSTTTNSSSVEVDYTLPTLDALSISSSNTTDSKHAKATEVVTLTMDFDDDLSSSPTVVFTSGSAAVADATITYTEVSDFTDDGNEVWTASYTVDASDTDGQVDFTLTYNDDAGNAGVALDNTSLDGGGASETIEIDKSAPTLDALSISSNNTTDSKHARATEVVTLTMDFDDDLATSPTVSFRSGSVPVQDATITYTEVSDFVADGDEVWTASYTVDAADFDGDVNFTLTYTDDVGNSGATSDNTDLDGGGATQTVEVDKAVPTLTSVTLATSNSTDNQHATTGETVTLSFTSSDDLSANPVVTMSVNDGTTTLAAVDGVTLTPGASNTYTATFVVDSETAVDPADNEGSVEFTIDFIDDAGNVGTQVSTTTNSSSVEVDYTVPTLDALSISSSNTTDSKHAKATEVVTLTMDFDDDLASSPTVVFTSGSAAVADATITYTEVSDFTDDGNEVWTASYTVDASDTDGQVDFTLTYNDDAGNAGVALDNTSLDGGGASETIEIDKSAPTLDALSISSNNTTDSKHARATEVVTLTIDFDDDLATSPTVSFRSGSVPVQDATITYTEVSDFVADGDEVWTASYTVDAADFDGDVDFTLTYTDDVGNSGATSDNTDLDSGGATQTVEVDKAVPTLTSVTLATSNSTDNQHASTGETVTLSFTSSDDLSANPVVTMSVNDGTTTLAAVDGVTLTPGASNTYTATFVVDSETAVDAADNEGSVEFTIDFIDDAGNVGTQVSTTTNSSSVEVDYTLPTLDALSISSSNTTDSKHAKATEVVTLTMDFDDDLASSPTVIFTSGSAAVADATITYTEVSDFTDDGNEVWTASYTVDASDTDGQVDFTLTYNDDAGNAGVALDNTSLDGGGASETIEIDKSAPILDALSISSNNTTDSKHARATEVVTLTMNFDDDLATSPTVSFRSGSVPVQDATITYTEVSDFVADGDEVWTASYTVDAADFDGDVNFTLTYTDDVGNSGATSDNTDLDSGGATQTVEVDKIDPTITFSNTLADPSNELPFVINADFDEVVTGLTSTDFTVSNGSITNITGTNPNFVIEITPIDPLNDQVSIFLNANSIIDDAGNTNVSSSIYNVDFDNIPPVITATAIVEGRSLTITAQLDEPGNLYYVVVADGTTVTSNEVKNVSGNASAAIASGTITVSAAGINTTEVVTLAADRTAYDLIIVSEDLVDGLNLLPTPQKFDISSGGVTISTATLVDVCLEGDFFSLNDIVISETITTDFNRANSNRTLILELPENFIFSDAGVVTDNGADVSIVSSGLNTSSTQLTITYSIADETAMDIITLSSLEVMASGSTIVTSADLVRSGGNGDIYGLNDDNVAIPVFAEITTIAPFDAPDIVITESGTETNPFIIELDNIVLGDSLGNAVTVYDREYVIEQGTSALTPFRIGALAATNTINIYSDENLSSLVVSSSGANYTPTLDDLNLTSANVGVNTFWITVTDNKSCESAATKFSIAIIRVENSPSFTVFSDSDQIGSIFRFSFPAGSSAVFTGDGLTNFNNNNDFSSPVEDGFSVKFLPTSAGAGRDTLKYALTNAAGETANYWIALLVNDTDGVFADANIGAAGLCVDSDPLSFDVIALTGVDINGNESSSGVDPDFYEIRAFYYANDTRGVELTDTFISGKPSITLGVPTSVTGWELNPGAVKDTLNSLDIYSIQIEAVMYITDETTQTVSELSTELVTLYRNPTITFTNLTDNNFYCEDDAAFNIRAQIISADGTTTDDIDDSGYELYKFDGTDFNTLIGAFSGSALLNPQDLDNDGIDYLNEDETGMYKVRYTSTTHTSAECASTIESTFTLLSKPDQPTFTNDFSGIGALNITSGEYLLEYCEGESVLDLYGLISPSNTDVQFKWYNDAGKSSEITEGVEGGAEQDTLNVADAFFGGLRNPTGRQTKTFYFTVTDHTSETDANGRVGCESEVRRVTIQIYPVPDEPVVTSLTNTGASFSTTNEHNSSLANDEYFFEYCVDEGKVVALEEILLDASFDTEQSAESYFVIFDSTLARIDSFKTIDAMPNYSLSSNNILDYFDYSAEASTSLSFYIAQRDFDNNYPTDLSAEFNGCESEKRKFNIVIYSKPAAPLADEFGGGAGGIVNEDDAVQYYLCSGDDLGDLTTPIQELASQSYSWYDSNNNEIDITSFGNRTVSQLNLTNATVPFSNVNSTSSAITYTYKVTQIFSRNDATRFGGCESDSTEVLITVFPDSGTPFMKISASDSTDNFEESYCVGSTEEEVYTFKVNPGASLKIYSVTSETDFVSDTRRGSLIETLFAEDGETEVEVSANDLGISSLSETIVYFKISQQTNIIEDSDGLSIFTGCETEIADMARMQFNIFDLPARPAINDNTLFYCDNDPIVDINVKNIANGAQVEWFNGEDNRLFYDFNVTIDSSIIPTDSLFITTADQKYSYNVYQRTNKGNGTSDFEGCINAEPLSVNITVVDRPKVDQLGITVTGDQCEYELTNISTNINYTGIADWLGTDSDNTGSITFFSFYSSDTTASPLSGGEVVTSANPLEERPFNVDLSSFQNQLEEDTTEFVFHLSQTVGVLNSETFEGCTSNFKPYTFEVYQEPDAPRLNLVTNENLTGNGTESNSFSSPNGVTRYDYEYSFCDTYTADDELSVLNPVDGERYIWYEEGAAFDTTNVLSLTNVADALGNFTVENNVYSGAASGRVSVATISESGCFTQSNGRNDVSLLISEIPEPQFKWERLTADLDGTLITVRDNNNRNSFVASTQVSINSIDNTFSDDRVFTGLQSEVLLVDEFPDYDFVPGSYEVLVTLTSTPTCVETSNDGNPRIMTLLETIEVPEGGSTEFTFNTGTEGWLKDQRDYERDGFVDRPTEAVGGDYGTFSSWIEPSNFGYWTTSSAGVNELSDEQILDESFTYKKEEQSWVYSPAFNTSAMENAIIGFDINYSFAEFRDGVVLQQSTDDGESWEPVGSYIESSQSTLVDLNNSSGVNWYINSNIEAVPGKFAAISSTDRGADFNATNTGWSDALIDTNGDPIEIASNEWPEALNSTLSAEHIRYRFALGANGASNDRGFAFDNFRIFDGNKVPLIETFNSTESLVARKAFMSTDTLLEEETGFVWINYFTGLAESGDVDELNEVNQGDPSARTGYYGVSSLPSTAIDGTIYEPAANSNDEVIKSMGWNSTIRDKALLEDNRVIINDSGITEVGDEFTIDLTVSFELTVDDLTEVSMKVVVIEKEVSGIVTFDEQGENQEIIYESTDIIRNVMRKMLPSQSGFVYNEGLTNGAIFTEQVVWEIKNVIDPDKIAVVVFVQDDVTKDVLQAKKIAITGKSEPPLSINGVDFQNIGYFVYPNPANNFFNVKMRRAATEDLSWSLYDQSGKMVRNGIIQTGVTSLEVDSEDLPSGVYLMNLKNEENNWIPQRVMIVH